MPSDQWLKLVLFLAGCDESSRKIHGVGLRSVFDPWFQEFVAVSAVFTKMLKYVGSFEVQEAAPD